MAATEEGAEEIQPDDAPEFLDRRIDHGVVLRCGAPRVVVEHVQTAERNQRRAERGPQARYVRDVSPDGNRAVASEVRRLLAGHDGDVCHGDAGPFVCEQHGGRAPYSGGGACDEGYLPCKSCHGPRSSVRECGSLHPRACWRRADPDCAGADGIALAGVAPGRGSLRRSVNTTTPSTRNQRRGRGSSNGRTKRTRTSCSASGGGRGEPK